MFGTAAKATKQNAKEKREERRCERLEGQCELSKLAVLLGDGKGKEREERMERETARLAKGGRRELQHLWCSQGNGKVAIAGRTRLAIGGLMCRGGGGHKQSRKRVLQALLCWGQIYEQRLNLRRS